MVGSRCNISGRISCCSRRIHGIQFLSKRRATDCSSCGWANVVAYYSLHSVHCGDVVMGLEFLGWILFLVLAVLATFSWVVCLLVPGAGAAEAIMFGVVSVMWFVLSRYSPFF